MPEQESDKAINPGESGTTGLSKQKFNATITFGVVAADKEFGSRTLKVYPQEMLPYAEGNLEAKEVTAKVGMPDDRVQEFQGEATLTNTITAEYMDMISNRVYPPDMRRGEQVILINLQDSDTWYWLPTGRNDNLRRCERLRYAISDDQAFSKELDNDNTYYWEINTLDGKYFVLSTSKSDGEEYRYLFKIDAQNSILQICDDDNNLILLESKEKHILIRNSDGSMFDLDKKNATVMAVEDLVMKGGRQIILESPVITSSHGRGDQAGVFQTKNMHIKTDSSLVIDAPAIGLNGQVTVPNSMIVKHIRSETTSAGPVEPGNSGESGGASGLLRAAQSFMMKESVAEAAGSGDVPVDSYVPKLIEENRPTIIKTVFKDGFGATTLREAASFTGVDKVIKGYTGVGIDLGNGSAKDPGNTPNTFDMTQSGNRQCASWDQMSPAFDRISLGIQDLAKAIKALAGGGDTGGLSISELADRADALGVEARTLAHNSVMPNNGGN